MPTSRIPVGSLSHFTDGTDEVRRACGDALHPNDMPILLVAQGGLRRASSEPRDAFFTNASQHLPPGTELVIDCDATALATRIRASGSCAPRSTRRVSRTTSGVKRRLAAVSWPQHAGRTSPLHVIQDELLSP